MELNLSQAAVSVGISRTTLYQHIKKGKLSVTLNRDSQKVVDTSELIRVYGELKNPIDDECTVGCTDGMSTICSPEQNLTPQLNTDRTDCTDVDTPLTHTVQVTELLRDQIQMLKDQVEKFEEENRSLKEENTTLRKDGFALREEGAKERSRLIALVEDGHAQVKLLTDQRQQSQSQPGFFVRLFGRLAA